MRLVKGSRVAGALVGSVLVAGLTVGCTETTHIDPNQMSRIEGAAGRSEAAANKAEAAAKSAADAAARAEAAADKAAAMFKHGLRK